MNVWIWLVESWDAIHLCLLAQKPIDPAAAEASNSLENKQYEKLGAFLTDAHAHTHIPTHPPIFPPAHTWGTREEVGRRVCSS